MKEIDISLQKDIDKRYIEAVELYQSEIDTDSNAPLFKYINLAFLYWEFAAEQFEFNIPNDIPNEWSEIGGNKYMEIIKKGLLKYPNNVELHFWKKYLPYRLGDDHFTEKDCEYLIEKYGSEKDLVPYSFLYLFDSKKYKEERNKLLEICLREPTAKNLYLKSLIESSFN